MAETGISYGQLYRWKRERLIPEEWFIKQSSYTGQETFFPKELILTRIREIQELKDVYSLEEVAKLLSPEITNHGFSIKEFEEMKEISGPLLQHFKEALNKELVTYMELLVMIILNRIQEQYGIKIEDIKTIFKNILPGLEKIKSTDYILTIIQLEHNYYSFIHQDREQILFDNRFHIISKVRIDEISSEIRVKYKDVYEAYMGGHKNSYQDNTEEWMKEKVKKDEQRAKDSEQRDEDENIYIGEVIFEDSNEHQDKEQDGASFKQRKRKEGDKIVIKFNNWEVRL